MNEKKIENTIINKEGTKREDAEATLEHNYERYQGLGGIINEKDYQNVFIRARDTAILNKALILQAESMAGEAGIALHNSEDALDPITIFYGILRTDTNPEAKYYHGQMSDQRLFAEALRMLGDADSLQKMIETYPHISF